MDPEEEANSTQEGVRGKEKRSNPISNTALKTVPDRVLDIVEILAKKLPPRSADPINVIMDLLAFLSLFILAEFGYLSKTNVLWALAMVFGFFVLCLLGSIIVHNVYRKEET